MVFGDPTKLPRKRGRFTRFFQRISNISYGEEFVQEAGLLRTMGANKAAEGLEKIGMDSLQSGMTDDDEMQYRRPPLDDR